MSLKNKKPSWAPRVPKAKILRLYTEDASGILDEELIDEVGWALWSRCDSIIEVTAAHYGRLHCPECGAAIQREPASSGEKPAHGSGRLVEEILQCPACGWQLDWSAYHQTYHSKQLFGINAIEVFEAYHRAFPQTHDPSARMLLIDQLIHSFHYGITEIGRPVGANLIDGSLKEVIQFLDQLTSGSASAAGIVDLHDQWRRNLETASWAHLFLKPVEGSDGDPSS